VNCVKKFNRNQVVEIADAGGYSYAYQTFITRAGKAYTFSGLFYQWNTNVDTSCCKIKWGSPSVHIYPGNHNPKWWDSDDFYSTALPAAMNKWEAFDESFVATDSLMTIYVPQNGKGEAYLTELLLTEDADDTCAVLVDEDPFENGGHYGGLAGFAQNWTMKTKIKLQWNEEDYISFSSKKNPFVARAGEKQIFDLTDFKTSDAKLDAWVENAAGAVLCIAATGQTDTAWAILPKNNDKWSKGCSADGWQGRGAYYAGENLQGGWVGVKDNGEIKATAKKTKGLILSACTDGDDAEDEAKGASDPYIVDEKQLTKAHFDVSAVCRPGYPGEAKVSSCAKHGQPYVLSGCEETLCLAPKKLPMGFRIKEKNLEGHHFDVSVECMPGYAPNGKMVVVPCASNLGEYTIDGACLERECTSPHDTTGYEVKEVSKSVLNFKSEVKCAEGFHDVGIEINPCGEDEDHNGENPYSLDGCNPDKCKPWTKEDHPTYRVIEAGLERREEVFDVTPRCAPNYQGTPVAKPCRAHGEKYILEGCHPAHCLKPAKMAGYVLKEGGSTLMTKFNVKAECDKKNGWVGENARVQKCFRAQTPYKLKGCVKAASALQIPVLEE